MGCTRRPALVTGASSGIGRATALYLAAAGDHVSAGVRRVADGGDLVRSAGGGELTPLLLDVTDPGLVDSSVGTVSRHVGASGLDGLVDNAGVGLACPVELLPLDTFRQLLEVNVTGQLAVTQAFLPPLRQAHGRVVVVSTIGVHFNPPFAGPLHATKAALAALADALRQELAPWGLRVVVVEPASIESPAAGKVLRDSTAVMAAVPPRTRALYEGTLTTVLAVVQRREAAGSPPEVAARTIARALAARRPRAVYRTGRYARLLVAVSALPTPVLDAVRRRVFGLPAPGSLAGPQDG